MTKTIEWWRNTSNHIWRTYFDISRQIDTGAATLETIAPSAQRIYSLCHRILYERFITADQDILRTYFSSRWGDDLYIVEDYSLKNNIPTTAIWKTIRRANRIVIEELGLLERKDGET